MPGSFKLRLLEGYNAFAAQYLYWEDIIRTTLRGSVKTKSSGDKTVFEDRWSGTEIVVKQDGKKLESIEVRAETFTDKGEVFKKIIDLDIKKDGPKIGAVKSDLKDFFKQSGQGDDALGFLDGMKSEQITLDERSTPKPPFDLGGILLGDEARDVFDLNDGTHFITATAGDDRYKGGKGLDSIDYSDIATSGGRGLKLSKASGGKRDIEKPDGSVDRVDNVDQIFGTPKDDNLKKGLGGKSSILYGQNGDDKLGGTNAADYLLGGDGRDELYGRKGADILIGGGDADEIKGGAGADILVGANGFGSNVATKADKYYGGKGKDLFVIESGSSTGKPVVIKDFENGRDFIGLVGSASSLGFGLDDLIFDDLAFRNAGGDAIISAEGRDIAKLKNTSTDVLGRGDFVEAFDLSYVPGIFYNETYGEFF